jgi:hypothetical protein
MTGQEIVLATIVEVVTEMYDNIHTERDELKNKVEELERERDKEAARHKEIVRDYVKQLEEGADRERRLREALTIVRAWIRDGEGSESEAAEAMDAALADGEDE